MPSRALSSLADRLKDVEQLMNAHTAAVQIRRARRGALQSGGQVAQAVIAIGNLVGPLQRGRVAEVESLNRAAIVLLSAHLEGFLEDIYAEAASSLLQGRVKSVPELIKEPKGFFRNPQPGYIEKLFRTLGFPEILNGVHWQKASDQAVRNRLTDYMDLRNKIAHGQQIKVRKSKVRKFTRFVNLFAEKFDEKLKAEIRNITNLPPW